MKQCGFVLAALLGAACGDNTPGVSTPDAGPSADANADTVAPTTTASPPGGAGFDVPPVVTLTADEPATIYYTTDGSAPTTSSPSGASPLEVTGVRADQPLRFFAVDASDNAEDVKAEAYTLDRAVTITIDDPAGTPVATVTRQPLGMTLTASNTQLGAPLGGVGVTVTFDLEITSAVDRRVFNLKAGVVSSSDGTVVTDGTVPGGLPFRYFGPTALAPGGSVTQTVQVVDVTGADGDALIQLELGDAPMLFSGDDYNTGVYAFDTSWGGVVSQVEFADELTYNGNDGSFSDAVITADQSTIYVPSRSLPQVIAFDTATLEGTLSASLSVLANSPNGVGCTNGLAMSPDEQYLYTVLVDGNHAYNGSDADGNGSDAVTIELVRLERATMAEVDRVTLMSAADVDGAYVRARTLAISPDGLTAVVPLQGARLVAVVDLATMTLRDADAGVAGTQLVDVGDAGDPVRDIRGVAISADGATAYLPAWKGDGTIMTELDLATLTTSTVTLDDAVPDVRATDAQVGPDGRLYVARRGSLFTNGGLLIVDPISGQQTQLFDDIEVASVAFAPDGATAIVMTEDAVEVLDLATDELRDLDADAGNGQTGFPITRFSHRLLLTRY